MYNTVYLIFILNFNNFLLLSDETRALKISFSTNILFYKDLTKKEK